MSGGVDSSVAAALSVDAGHQVTGLFMKNWEEDDDGVCAAATDLADAAAVADSLGIELRTVNFATEYWDRVFANFLSEHERGRTPNPDVLCNREIKFKEFRDHAARLGANQVATGHYARIRYGCDGRIRLLKASDTAKDQSYFLHALSQEALRGVIFPLGEMNKQQVRAFAAGRRLVTHAKRDSTGLCFIGERPFREFLARFLQGSPGPIVDENDRQIGTHRGAAFYTIGQRQGLGIGGLAGYEGGDGWYVAAKDMAKNTLRVVPSGHHPALYSNTLRASATHWIGGAPPGMTFAASAKTRYRQPDQACQVDVDVNDEIVVSFHQNQRAVTPGQFVVLYADDECLGGAAIEHCWQDSALHRRGSSGLA
ncbi:MAG: tRNA 2-thiouridine(34) synthase MnmA [Chromatiales bacterium]|jgi:tRNA-uridine 2-sulfurtransferase|nr:tRNA 2-thiouridine(34) synthase MnmA [Chromatiales bacterium]